jgi:hypothetical protein
MGLRMTTRTRWTSNLVVVAAVVAGCSAESDRFFIVQDQVPSASCQVGPERTVYRGEGVLDLSLVGSTSAGAYQLFPLLQNDLPAVGEANASQPNRLFVRAFRVRVEPGDAAPAKVTQLFERLGADPTRSLIEFQVAWAGTVEPGGGVLPAAVTVIPGELARQLRATRALEMASFVNLTVRVRAVGARQGGDLESREFVFPVRACDGCLVSRLSPCPYTPANRGHGCNVAQDDPVDCCVTGNALVCPAIPAAGP